MPLVLMIDKTDRNNSINIYDRSTGERVLEIELLEILPNNKIKLGFSGDALVTRKSICDDDNILDKELLNLGAGV